MSAHRVLIFSQMVRVLDIMSDYMRRRGYQHQRLDGSTPAHARHQAMEHFNAPGESWVSHNAHGIAPSHGALQRTG